MLHVGTTVVEGARKYVTEQYWESDGKALGYRGTVCGMRWEHYCFPPNDLSPFSFPVLIPNDTP